MLVMIVLLLDYTTLGGSFPDEEVIVVNDTFQIIAAIVELPQLLVDWGLIMQDIDDEFFIDVLAWAGGIFQNFFWLFQKY